jgi:hypothetical protein
LRIVESNNDPNEDGLRDETYVAQFFDVALSTVQRWRTRGIGPKCIRVGPRLIRYRQQDLAEFIAHCPTRAGKPPARSMFTFKE